MYGARITDAVAYFQRRGQLSNALYAVRDKVPERFRWRGAVGSLTSLAGRLRGRDRMRVEEPVREVVLDLPDVPLLREVVLDARRVGVDLDRGEILPARSIGDLRRFAFLTGTDLSHVQRYLPIQPEDFFAPVETSAVVLVGRAYANAHRRRAHQLWLSIPDPDGPEGQRLHHRVIADRADREARMADRWGAFARAVLEPDR